VEDHEPAALQRREVGRDLRDQVCELALGRLGIAAIGFGVVGIECSEFGGDGVEPDARVFGVEPGMRIMPVVVVAMRVAIGVFCVVVIRRGVVVIVMRMLGMGMIRFGMVVFVVCLLGVDVIVVILRAVVVRVETRALAEFQHRGALGLHQRHHPGPARQRIERTFQPGRQVRADPENRLRPVQGACLGGAQGIAVRRGAGLHQQLGTADARHDPRDQRMDRRDIGDDGRRLGAGGGAQGEGGRGTQDQLLQHGKSLLL
jgi:hypothetical protein